jgi:hypothetical protein
MIMMCTVRVSTKKSLEKSKVEELIMGSLQHSILGGQEFLFVTKGDKGSVLKAVFGPTVDWGSRRYL